MDITQKLEALKAQVAKNAGLRAEAEGTLKAAKTRLNEVDAELTALGFTPERAEQELAALETQLGVELDALLIATQQEEQELQTLLAKARA